MTAQANICVTVIRGDDFVKPYTVMIGGVETRLATWTEVRNLVMGVLAEELG